MSFQKEKRQGETMKDTHTEEEIILLTKNISQ